MSAKIAYKLRAETMVKKFLLGNSLTDTELLLMSDVAGEKPIYEAMKEKDYMERLAVKLEEVE